MIILAKYLSHSRLFKEYNMILKYIIIYYIVIVIRTQEFLMGEFKNFF